MSNQQDPDRSEIRELQDDELDLVLGGTGGFSLIDITDPSGPLRVIMDVVYNHTTV